MLVYLQRQTTTKTTKNMKTYRVFYNSTADVEELKQFNNLNEAIEYTKSLLPSKVQLYDSNYDEHYCSWAVTEIIFDEDGDIENEIDHFVSQLYYEEEFFRKKFGYPDGVETLKELADYIKEYGDSDCVDYICEKNGWEYETEIVTDGEYIVTRTVVLYKTETPDYLRKGSIVKSTERDYLDL